MNFYYGVVLGFVISFSCLLFELNTHVYLLDCRFGI